MLGSTPPESAKSEKSDQECISICSRQQSKGNPASMDVTYIVSGNALLYHGMLYCKAEEKALRTNMAPGGDTESALPTNTVE